MNYHGRKSVLDNFVAKSEGDDITGGNIAEEHNIFMLQIFHTIERKMFNEQSMNLVWRIFILVKAFQ